MTLPADDPSASLGALLARARSRLAGKGVAGSAFRTLTVSVAGAGISFVGQIVLARALGLEGFGVYLMALAVMNASLILGKFEMDGASARFLAGYVGAGQWSLARGFARWSRRMGVIASLIVAALGATVVLLFEAPLSGKNAALPGALLAACALLIVNARLIVNQGHLQALRRFVDSLVPGTVVRPALFATAIGIGYFVFGWRAAPSQAILVNLLATAVAVGLTTIWLRRARPVELTSATPEADRPRWLKATYGLVAIGIAQLIISQQSDLIIVGAIVSPAQAALYGAAAQFAYLLTFGQTSVSFVAAPMIAELHERRDKVELQRLVRALFIANTLVTIPIVLGLVFFGHYLLRLYGPEYDAAHPVLILLSLSALSVGIVGGTAGFLLTMTEYQQEAAWVIGASAVLNLALTLTLTPRFGLIGTASATLVATVARSAVLVFFIRMRMGISVIPGM
ncbi:MAG: oligosaccharide flippase family protein [Gemmatimonadaceae bacterium]